MFVLVLTLPTWARGRPASWVLTVDNADLNENTAASVPDVTLGTAFISEGFEGVAFPPAGWQVIMSTTQMTYTWRTLSGPGNAHTGEKSVGVIGGSSSDLNQREVLLTPPFEVRDDRVNLIFWIMVLNQDSFDLSAEAELWVVRGNWDAGTVDDVRLDPDDIGLKPPGSNFWTELKYNLAAYVGETIRIGWRYRGYVGSVLIDDVRVEHMEPEFVPPHSYVIAPYKVEPGQVMTYVLVLSNTGPVLGTGLVVRDALPTEWVTHTAATARVGFIGSGSSAAFTDTPTRVEWSGNIPVASAVLITIPVQVIGSPGAFISNTVTVEGPDLLGTVDLAAVTRIFPRDSVVYYESFNGGPGDVWQSDGKWEWGVPLKAPDSPHSWPGAWGTVLNGNYQDGQVYVLTGTIDLTPVPTNKTVVLQWWEWFDGNSSGTPDQGSVMVNGESVYEVTLDRTEWTERELDISAYAGQEIRVVFKLTALGVASVGAGWYVDDVAIHVYPPAAGFAGSWKRVDRTKVAPGGQVTYTLYITNSGFATSIRGRMRDELPQGLLVNRVFASGRGRVTSGANYVEWRTTDVDSMPVGTDATITVVADVSPTLRCGEMLINSAVITEAEGRAGTPIRAVTVGAYPGKVYFAHLFDTNDGGLTEQGGVWEWGETVAYGDGPAWDGEPAHSEPKVWGTRLAQDVVDSGSAYTLTLPALDLSRAVSLPPTLQWWDWYEPGDSGHVGSVFVSTAVSPTLVEVYRVEGDSGAGWHHHSVDLSPFIGHLSVGVHFVYRTDGDGKSGPGWFIDSLALHDDCFCIGLAEVGVVHPFEFDPLPGEQKPVVGQTITFTASYSPPESTGPIDFVWSFDDGTPQKEGRRATHIFDDPGDFSVVLAGSNCGGADSYSETVAILAYPVYAVSLNAEGGSATKGGLPGETVFHRVVVTNVGNRQDRYNVSKSSATWATTVFPNTTNDLLPLASQTVLVAVTIPGDARKGDSDSVTVTLASTKDPALTEEIVLTTTYLEYPYPVYLPLVVR